MTGMLQALAPIVGRLDGIVVGRMLLTVLLCGLVGIERSTRERASGFRPHILVGVGACLMTLAGGYGFSELAGGVQQIAPFARQALWEKAHWFRMLLHDLGELLLQVERQLVDAFEGAVRSVDHEAPQSRHLPQRLA